MAAIGRIFKGTWVDLPVDKGARMDGKGPTMLRKLEDGTTKKKSPSRNVQKKTQKITDISRNLICRNFTYTSYSISMQ